MTTEPADLPERHGVADVPGPRARGLRGSVAGPAGGWPVRRRAAVAVMLAAVWLAACGGSGGSTSTSGQSAPDDAGTAGPEPQQQLTPAAQLGQRLFADPRLSVSGQQSCGTCHVRSAGLAQDNAQPAQPGGALMTLQGHRTSPSIRYLARNTPFFFQADGTPTGGFFWDGRATSLIDQATHPFVDPVEMANPDFESVAQKLAGVEYAGAFRALFGQAVFDDADATKTAIAYALQSFERESDEFNPYSSKYDEFLRGRAALTAAELRGLALFNDPKKGNCAACHPSARGADGALPVFTDFTYDSLGLPRNMALTQNQDPTFFDLGLCARPDGSLLERRDLCGKFKVPSLRNVAIRKSLFHNGSFTSLREAIRFYVQRDTNPERFYPLRDDGTPDKFNDLPEDLRGNVNVTEVPYNRAPGDEPALNDAEIDDVLTFLDTLTDGWTP